MLLQELFETIPTVENRFLKFVSKYQNADKKIFLFGAGLCGHLYLQILERHQLHVDGIIDNFKDSLDGRPVLRLTDVLSDNQLEKCLFIISAPRMQKEILQQLLKVCSEEQIFAFAMSRYISPDNEPIVTKNYLLSHKDEIKSVYNLLADEQSKNILFHTIMGRLTADYDQYASLRTGDIYYPPDLISFHKDEVMVELGSNNGETLLDFIHRCPTFKKAYCFEPDVISIKILQNIVAPYAGRITIIPKIAWKQQERLSFISDVSSFSSRVDMEGNGNWIEAVPVDSEVKENITYMKMDIEGSEMMALQGAREQIIQNKPKLAVSVYHKNEDIVEIPQYILSLRPDYKLFLRHHGWDDSDTVLYAV